jgi:membrane-associated HD superfamily phosphohydrolase
VLLACVLVALVSSWPWLVEPSLRPGIPAPFTARAPKAARVVDSDALEQRRSQLGPRTHVQVVDPRLNQELQQRLERQLREINQIAAAPLRRVTPLELSPVERRWLTECTPEELAQWQQQLRLVQRRMLHQGLVTNVAERQLQQAAALQLEGEPDLDRSLGSRLIASSLHGGSNLRIDAALSLQLIEDLLTQQGIPTINVRPGDVITRQGEAISPQAFAVLDYFGLVNRRPLVGAWLGHFSEALAACIVMLLLTRRWRPSLEPRQALLALAMLLVVQGCKLWFGGAAIPLALLVPPTLLLAQGPRVAPEAIERALLWLSSSSPSALLLASCEAAIEHHASRAGVQQRQRAGAAADRLRQRCQDQGLPLLQLQVLPGAANQTSVCGSSPSPASHQT